MSCKYYCPTCQRQVPEPRELRGDTPEQSGLAYCRTCDTWLRPDDRDAMATRALQKVLGPRWRVEDPAQWPRRH